MLLHIRLPGLDGLAAIARLRAFAPAAPVIIMTAFGTLDTAAAAVREGVFEYLVKPFSLAELKAVLNRALASRVVGTEELRSSNTGDEIVGRSPIMQRVFNRVALAAATDVARVVDRRDGNRKEVLARAIHRYGTRRPGPFVPVFLAAAQVRCD